MNTYMYRRYELRLKYTIFQFDVKLRKGVENSYNETACGEGRYAILCNIHWFLYQQIKSNGERFAPCDTPFFKNLHLPSSD